MLVRVEVGVLEVEGVRSCWEGVTLGDAVVEGDAPVLVLHDQVAVAKRTEGGRV